MEPHDRDTGVLLLGPRTTGVSKKISKVLVETQAVTANQLVLYK